MKDVKWYYDESFSIKSDPPNGVFGIHLDFFNKLDDLYPKDYIVYADSEKEALEKTQKFISSTEESVWQEAKHRQTVPKTHFIPENKYTYQLPGVYF